MIYLDHAAATPLSQKARLAMEPYFAEQFWNPSAPYLPAQAARDAYESAKNTITRALGGKGTDLTITASATESINLAFTAAGSGSILISATEHPSVREAARRAGNYDTIEVNKHGVIALADLANKITGATQLISIALVSSELGTIQPLSQVAQLVRAERARRAASGETTPLYLHSDASQALSLLDVKISRLGTDLLTISSPKIYGPKGIAALWVRPGINLQPLIVGGGQEQNLRSGTENVPAVIGFAAAITEATATAPSERKRLGRLKATLRDILATNQQILFLGDPEHQLPSHLPLVIPGTDAECLIYKLEESEVYVSTGAACAANKHEISPSLLAIGLTPSQIAGSLRLTLGKLNTEADIRRAGALILAAIAAEQERVQ